MASSSAPRHDRASVAFGLRGLKSCPAGSARLPTVLPFRAGTNQRTCCAARRPSRPTPARRRHVVGLPRPGSSARLGAETVSMIPGDLRRAGGLPRPSGLPADRKERRTLIGLLSELGAPAPPWTTTEGETVLSASPTKPLPLRAMVMVETDGLLAGGRLARLRLDDPHRARHVEAAREASRLVAVCRASASWRASAPSPHRGRQRRHELRRLLRDVGAGRRVDPHRVQLGARGEAGDGAPQPAEDHRRRGPVQKTRELVGA
jgi:hypothetical protein